MGTIINGNKWSGACVNGNIVNGLVKNGIIFYKKNQQELYKRRIMVGDNLKGKNIYSVFPENHWNNMEVSYGTNNYIISLENSDYGIYEILIIGPMDDIYRVASFGISDEYLYDYDVDSGTEDQNNSSFDSNSDYIVSSVVQANSSYRCLYIEDPNIRPIQVGDNIVRGTKLYYVFPDNISEIYKIKEDLSTENIFTCSDGRSYFSLDKLNYDGNEVHIGVSAGRHGWTIYKAKVDEQNNIIETLHNSSDDVLSDVTSVIDNINIPELAKCILVDTTTLGA